MEPKVGWKLLREFTMACQFSCTCVLLVYLWHISWDFFIWNKLFKSVALDNKKHLLNIINMTFKTLDCMNVRVSRCGWCGTESRPYFLTVADFHFSECIPLDLNLSRIESFLRFYFTLSSRLDNDCVVI